MSPIPPFGNCCPDSVGGGGGGDFSFTPVVEIADLSTDYDVVSGDRTHLVRDTPGNINLPAGDPVGSAYLFKDIEGAMDAGPNVVTITAPLGETIDQQATALMDDDFIELTIVKVTATEWMLA